MTRRRISPAVLLFISCVVGLLTGSPAAQQPQPSAGVITGSVVEEDTNAPIVAARVWLFPLFRPPDNQVPQQLQVPSGSDGTFRFEGVPPGRYGLRAEKTGYAMPVPGIGRPPIVTLEAGGAGAGRDVA